MIALSTTWGRERFESYPALFLAQRERFPAFELSLPTWPGCPQPRARDFRKAGVEGTDVALHGPDGLRSLTEARDAAKASGIRRVAFDGFQVPRPEGWELFLRALKTEDGATKDREETVRDGLAWRRENGSRALESLARALFDATRNEPDLLFCLQTPPDPTGLPSPEDLHDLLGDVDSSNLAYCHVAGRASFLEAAAGWNAREWLDQARDATVMAVLDDGGPGGAGLLPGTGTVQFRELGELLPRGTRFVLRPGEDAEEALLAEAASFLASQGFS